MDRTQSAPHVHVLQPRTNRPLTVWRCSCGTIEVGTPDDPYPTEPWRHRTWQHEWAPLPDSVAQNYLRRIGAK